MADNGHSDNDIKEIKHGMFIMPFHPPPKPLAQGFDEDLELAIRIEELGFKELWVGEHHTMKYETLASPEMFIARVLGETSTLRMGPAPVCLQLHHPAHVASRLSCLDHLSHGRLNVCFGPSSVSTDIELFGTDPKEGAAMTDEAAEMIMELWTTDPPYHIDGKYWNIHLEKFLDDEVGLGFIHKPFQLPHPPIAAPATSRNSPTMRLAGKNGYWPIGQGLVAGNVLADNWKVYSESALEAGREPKRSDFRILRTMFLADTTKEAEERVRSNIVGFNFNYIASLMDRGPGRKIMKRDLDMPDSDVNMDYWLTEQIIAADVDTALDRLLGLVDEIGPFGHIILSAYDWDDKESWLHSMDLFANELMPAFNKAVLG